jgi:hypothetical protein
MMDLRQAIHVLVKEEFLGDWVYNIRERTFSDTDYNGSSWDHPRVKRFSEAVKVLEDYLDE